MGPGIGNISTSGMGTMATYALLKAEAQNFLRTGVSAVLQDTVAKELMHPYLTGTAAKPHVDTTGDAFVANNCKIYEEQGKEFTESLNKDTGTTQLNFDKEKSLHLYCNLVGRLKTAENADDGVPKFYLDSAAGPGGPVKRSGGFQRLYNSINVKTEYWDKSQQDRCIFALTGTAFKQMGGTVATYMIDTSKNKVQTLFPDKNPILKKVHILFNWNAHSFFTYHQDDDGDMTMMINLSHGKAYMHVAGHPSPAEYDGIGSAHLFPSKAFHRSGTAPRRCIKIALFYALTKHETVDVTEDGDEEDGGAAEDVKVKNEADSVKSEVPEPSQAGPSE